MGLDIYLQRSEIDLTQWSRSEIDLTQCSGDEEPESEQIEFNSAKYPEHMFKVGYFRSSYNNSGINSILKLTIGRNLYDIMGVSEDSESDYIKPNWHLVKENTILALNEYKKIVEETGDYRLKEVYSIRDPKDLPDKNTAFRLFKDELKKRSHKSYENSQGIFQFDDDPLDLVAVMHGKAIFNTYASFLIFKVDRCVTESYFQSMEIIIETCDYVLEQEDSTNYYLRWSS